MLEGSNNQPPQPVSNNDPTESGKTVVIQPGSSVLRLGLATDTSPHCTPHVIARLNNRTVTSSRSKQKKSHDNGKSSSKAQQGALGEMESYLSQLVTSSGYWRPYTPPEQVGVYNSRVKPVRHTSTSNNWTDVKHRPKYITGKDALHIHPDEPYDIRWPFAHGQLNLGGGNISITSALQDVEDVWRAAVTHHLNITQQQISEYNAILLVSDITNRNIIKHYMDILLTELGFRSAVVVQESVMATFGLGVTSACVVDVGHEKCSVCCVEDGLSHRSTRITLKYGGSEVTQLFGLLLKRGNFPYKHCDTERITDKLLVQELKENFCHLDKDSYGVQSRDFVVTQHGQSTSQSYQINLSDEMLLAPLGLFYPLAFTPLSDIVYITQRPQASQPEDIFDQEYLMQTQSNRGRPSAVGGPGGDDGVNQDMETESIPDEESRDDIAASKTNSQSGLSADSRPGLDDAIIQSIESCATDDMRLRMYSCILLIGCGLNFRSAETMLQDKLRLKMPKDIQKRLDNVDFVRVAKDMDPGAVTWKGGAILAALDSIHECWIGRREWKEFGLKLLRERSLFVW